jgi:hypothetical protein
MTFIFTLAFLLVCLFVVGASICRLDMLHANTHRQVVILAYTFSATFAFGVALDVLHGREVTLHHALGVIAMALLIQSTRRRWSAKPPDSSRKDFAP